MDTLLKSRHGDRIFRLKFYMSIQGNSVFACLRKITASFSNFSSICIIQLSATPLCFPKSQEKQATLGWLFLHVVENPLSFSDICDRNFSDVVLLPYRQITFDCKVYTNNGSYVLSSHHINQLPEHVRLTLKYIRNAYGKL
jgi:hypothetical protein